jgi:hypothetical protein
MANPELRTLYLNQSCEGFAGSYINLQGDAVGVAQYDYRRVTDGMLLVQPDHVEWNDFYENIPDTDKELELYEKADMIRNWNLVNVALDANEMDPSSPIGNLL